MKKKKSLVGFAAFMLFASLLPLLSCSNDDEQDFMPETSLFEAQPVDLGLSVMWADCNVGAICPEDFGGLYGWAVVSDEELLDCSCIDENFNWISHSYGGVRPPDNICGGDLDIANSQWGDGWRLPSGDELKELSEKCRWEWVVMNGVSGMNVTGPNGNSIFLPAAGDKLGETENDRGEYGSYVSGSLYDYDDCYMWTLDFRPESEHALCGSLRMLGVSVRPVKM